MGSFDNNTVPSSCCIDPDKCVQGNSTVVNLPTNANETSKLIYTDVSVISQQSFVCIPLFTLLCNLIVC